MSAWDYIKCYLGIPPSKSKEYEFSSNVKNVTYVESDDTDLDDDGDYITLTTAEGENIKFLEVAGINFHGSYYMILQPEELLEGMADDEALVFKVTTKENGDNSYDIELDEGIVDGVFAEYNRILDEQEGKTPEVKKSSASSTGGEYK